MLIYKVVIDCWWQPPKKGALVKRVRRMFLLEAADRHQAKIEGLSHADSTAGFGKDWTEFEFVESATVQLPLELS